MKRNVREVGRPNTLRHPIHLNVIFEEDRVNDFRQMCHDNEISFSEGLRQLMEQELEKKEVGELPNPLGLPKPSNSYITNITQKPFQTDIREFMYRNKIIQLTKDLDIHTCKTISDNLSMVVEFKRTGRILLP
jgi:hypothetical protein